MNNEKYHIIKKHTDTLIEQTKTKPQKTLELKMNKQMQTFFFSPPINLVEEGKQLLGVSSLECTNCVFNITDKNNSFSVNKPGRWRIPDYSEDGVILKLKKLLELREQDDFKLLAQEIRKKGKHIKIGAKE